MINISLSKTLQGADGVLNLNFNTEIRTGELVSIYGPSGSGKTTILRILAGLASPDEGLIQIDNKIWYDKSRKINIKPQYRNIGMVFQEYTLFPNMNVRGNLEFALDKSQSKNIVDELLRLMELGKLQDQKPHLLSGGQKQRVALARALVRRPSLLLLDEPLSALDSEMQSRLQDYILKLHKQFNLTTILVSHNILEVIKMSDRVLVLENGVIVKDGLPRDVLSLDHLKNLINTNNK